MLRSIFFLAAFWPLAALAQNDTSADSLYKAAVEDLQTLLKQKYVSEIPVTVATSSPKTSEFLPVLRSFHSALEEGAARPGLFSEVGVISFAQVGKVFVRNNFRRRGTLTLTVPSNFSADNILAMVEDRLELYRFNRQLRDRLVSLLKEQYGYGGEGISLVQEYISNPYMASYQIDVGIDTDDATRALEKFGDVLEGQNLTFEKVRKVYLALEGDKVEIVGTPPRDIVLYAPMNLSAHQIGIQLATQTVLHQLKVEVLQLLKDCCAYSTNHLIATPEVGDAQFISALNRFKRDFSRAAARPDLQGVNEVAFVNDREVRAERIRQTYRSPAWRLWFPVEFNGNLATAMAVELKGQQEVYRQMRELIGQVNQLLREKHHYTGAGIMAEEAVSDLGFVWALRVFKSFLIESPPLADLEGIRRIFMAGQSQVSIALLPGRSFLNSYGLYIPATANGEFLQSQLPLAFAHYHLEKKVRNLLLQKGLSGNALSSADKLPRAAFAQGLEHLRELLESTPDLDLSSVRSITIANQQEVSVFRYNDGKLALHLPARISGEALLSGVVSKLEIHRDSNRFKEDISHILEEYYGYRGGQVAVAQGVGEEKFFDTLKSLREALYESAFNFPQVREIVVNKDKEARIGRHSSRNYLVLYLPAGVSDTASMITLLANEFGAHHFKGEIISLLKEFYHYRGDAHPAPFGGLAKAPFTLALENFKAALEDNAMALDLSSVSNIFFGTGGERAWVQEYQDGRLALHLPAGVPAEFFVPLMQTALLPLRQLESEVNYQLRRRGYRGRRLRNNPQFRVGEVNYAEVLKKLLVGLQTANFAVDLNRVGEVWVMGKRGHPRLQPLSENSSVLVIPQNLATSSIVTLSPVATSQLLDKVKLLLNRRELSMQFSFHWSASEEEVAMGLEQVHTVLAEDWPLENLGHIKRMVFTGGPNGRLWMSGETLYVPSSAGSSDIAAFLKDNYSHPNKKF